MFFIYIAYYSVETCRITNYTDLLSMWMCCDLLILPVYIESKSLLRESLNFSQKHAALANEPSSTKRTRVHRRTLVWLPSKSSL